MAVWSVTAQLTSGTLTVGTSDRIWLNGTNAGDNVTVGSYQDSTHITGTTDFADHKCSTNHVHNTKFLTASTVSLDGGGSVNLNTLTTGQVGFLFNFSDASSVATSAAKFYAYDGSTDVNAMVGVDFKAFEQSNTNWTTANGSGSALNLADQSGSTSHNFYIGISASPTSTGAKSGKVKITLTYV